LPIKIFDVLEFPNLFRSADRYFIVLYLSKLDKTIKLDPSWKD